jgi:peptide/nickel transport system permease protein
MNAYALRRLVLLIPTILGMALLIFLMVRLLPGDFVDALVGADPTISDADRERLRDFYGLNQSLPLQFGAWVGGLLRGDLGVSYRTQQPILDILLKSLPITAQLALMSMFFATIVAVPLGVLSALRQNTQTDFWARIAGLIGLSLPNFWLATLLLLFTSLTFRWVPPVIWVSPRDNLAVNLQQMLLPTLALSLQLIAVQMRMTRAAMLEVLRQDYVRTARAKGLQERLVVYRHALRNAFIPVITVMGLQFGVLMGGSVIIEQIFGLPGIGWYLLQAIFNRDYPVVQVMALFLAVIFVLTNLIVDILHGYLDPRIHYS